MPPPPSLAWDFSFSLDSALVQVLARLCLFIFIHKEEEEEGVMSAPEDEEKPTFDSVKSGRDTEAKFKYVSYSCVCVCVCVFEAGSPSCLFACLLVVRIESVCVCM